MPAVTKPFGLLARLSHPIDFNAIDDQPVDLVFVLLLPALAERDPLGALAATARTLRRPEILAELRRAKSSADLYFAMVG
jgi:PTS system nitrogen regulatory IIA component